MYLCLCELTLQCKLCEATISCNGVTIASHLLNNHKLTIHEYERQYLINGLPTPVKVVELKRNILQYRVLALFFGIRNSFFLLLKHWTYESLG